MKGAPEYSLIDITAPYIGKPFSEYSCAKIVHQIYADIGITIPDHIGDLTLDNYMPRFKEDPKYVTRQLIQLVESLGKPIEAHEAFVWDLLVCEQPEHQLYFPAIHAGHGVICSGEELGVSVVPLSDHYRIHTARRLI